MQMCIRDRPNGEGVIHIDLMTAEESIQKRAVRCDEEEYYNCLLYTSNL